MFDLLIKGGPVLWLLLALAVPVVAIVIERLAYFKKIRTDEEKLFQRARSAVEKGHFEEAMAICDTNQSPLASLIRVGIENRQLNDADLKEAVKDAAAGEILRLEKYVPVLGVIANISPLLGLLGTVTGIINAFGVLGQFGSVSDPSILAKGISEALLTTAAGIVIAVPAMVCFSWLGSKVNKIITQLEGKTSELLRVLGRVPEPKK